jgi:putative pectin methylesterase
MSRRPVNSNRRLVDGGGLPLAMSLQSKSISSPLLTIGLVVLVIYLFIYLLLYY